MAVAVGASFTPFTVTVTVAVDVLPKGSEIVYVSVLVAVWPAPRL
ncbi:hypothetical protein BOBR111200_20655 [Bordetella bronchialis]